MSLTVTLRDYQDNSVCAVRKAFQSGARNVLLQLPTGGGKCLGKDTLVLMYDGTIKLVQDVVAGDILMGPDSLPRTVMSTCKGNEPLYRVTPKKGDSYVVNESHILSLKRTHTSSKPVYPSERRGGEVVNISVLDYIQKSKNFKHIHKGWRTGVNFPPHNSPPLIEPYFMGLWLGDGNSRTAAITTGDQQIIDAVTECAARMGMTTHIKPNSKNSVIVEVKGIKRTGRGGTYLMNSLRKYSLVLNKHIPYRYKTGSRKERRELLAGIIDTDGYYCGKGYSVTLKSEILLEDIIFVARSLGFSANKSIKRKKCYNTGAIGTYFSCFIAGDVDEIPCKVERKKANPRRQKKSQLVTGITVEPIGPGEYYGFEISGPDRLFLLGDFTVTHNTVIFCYITASAAGYGNDVLILVHRKELIIQCSMALTALGVSHGIIAPGFPSTWAKVQIASVQTLVNRLDRITPPRLIISDECHHAGATSWAKIFLHFPHANILGVTATPCRLDGRGLGRDAGGFFDVMVCGPSIKELITRGFLAEPKLFAPPIGADLSSLHKRAGDFITSEAAAALDKPAITGCAVQHYRSIVQGAPSIAFCSSVAHAEHVAEEFRQAGYNAASIDGSMHDNDRRKRITDLGTGSLNVLTSCDIISEGTDIPIVAGAILLRPTDSLSLFMQQVGRALRMYEGKKCAYILDHVGNCHRHGLPDADREWNLLGTKGQKKKSDEEKDIKLKQCEVCYSCHLPAPVCPNCGNVYPKMQREIEHRDGELVEFDRERFEQMERDRQKQFNRIEERKCKTLEDFQALAAARGYNPGWAYHRYRARTSRG